jgi:methylated-DNA-[protein]-cysteine S-methyltransferase
MTAEKHRVICSSIETPIGRLALASTTKGLCRVCFGEEDEILTWLEENIPSSIYERSHRENGAYERALHKYFSGKLTKFDLKLDIIASGFRHAALRELAKVPFGQTISYGELAARAGNPRAARAAGTACAHNPIAIVIPCHRVIASDGGIGGFGGRTDIKRFLLKHEGVDI